MQLLDGVGLPMPARLETKTKSVDEGRLGLPGQELDRSPNVRPHVGDLVISFLFVAQHAYSRVGGALRELDHRSHTVGDARPKIDDAQPIRTCERPLDARDEVIHEKIVPARREVVHPDFVPSDKLLDDFWNEKWTLLTRSINVERPNDR